MTPHPQNYTYSIFDERKAYDTAIDSSVIGGPTPDAASGSAAAEYNRKHPDHPLTFCEAGDCTFRLDMQGADGSFHQYFLKKNRRRSAPEELA